MSLISTSRRRRGRSQAGLPIEPNLTPLLDIVLQLIVFLLMLVQLGSQMDQAAHTVKLPVAPATLPTGLLGSDLLTVGLDPSGRLLVPDSVEPLDPAQANAWWAAQANQKHNGSQRRNTSTEVILRADAAARYGTIRRALATAQNHGFRWFSLVVTRGNTP